MAVPPPSQLRRRRGRQVFGQGFVRGGSLAAASAQEPTKTGAFPLGCEYQPRILLDRPAALHRPVILSAANSSRKSLSYKGLPCGQPRIRMPSAATPSAAHQARTLSYSAGAPDCRLPRPVFHSSGKSEHYVLMRGAIARSFALAKPALAWTARIVISHSPRGYPYPFGRFIVLG